MILMKFSFVPQTLFRIFYFQDQDFTMKFIEESYSLYAKDIHQILFGSAKFFESYCVHMKSPRTTARRPDRQTDRQRQTDIFLCCFIF